MIFKAQNIKLDDQEGQFYEEWGEGMVNIVFAGDNHESNGAAVSLYEYLSLNPHLEVTLVIKAKQGPKIDEEAQKKIEEMSE